MRAVTPRRTLRRIREVGLVAFVRELRRDVRVLESTIGGSTFNPDGSRGRLDTPVQ